jgi:hypothetical protein
VQNTALIIFVFLDRAAGLSKVVGLIIVAGPEDFAGLDRAAGHEGIAGLGKVVGLDKVAVQVSFSHTYFLLLSQQIVKLDNKWLLFHSYLKIDSAIQRSSNHNFK